MRIIFTGGGTAGHILPNIAIHEACVSTHEAKRSAPYEGVYIGSKDGPERKIAEQHGLKFYGISTGKLRRYFSWKNFLSPFQIGAGFFQAFSLLRRLRPDTVMSKGGYVSVPVVIAAWFLKIPVVLHESDISPGLANRICARFARLVCVAWPETQRYFPHNKTLVTGIPLRKKILHGEKKKGFSLCGFDDEQGLVKSDGIQRSKELSKKPVLLIMGGSLGAQFLNHLTEKMLPKLLKFYDVVHVTGRGKKTAFESFESGNASRHYKQFEYLDSELADIYTITDVILGRAGANSLAEIAALKKPSILIPLGLEGSRGDQILNAEKFESMGAAIAIRQEKASAAAVEKILIELASDPKKREAMGKNAYEFGTKCVRAAELMADLVADPCIITS